MAGVYCGRALWVDGKVVATCDRMGKADTHPMRRDDGGLGLGHPIHAGDGYEWIEPAGGAVLMRQPSEVAHG